MTEAISDGLLDLDAEIFHRDIEPPNWLKDYTVVGGGSALIEPRTKTVYVVGCSGAFGHMASDAILDCLQHSGYSVILDNTVAQSRANSKTYFVDKGRATIGKVILSGDN